ncbi:hypothetical protein O181_122389 [Austropuccinia psidii MF-1]|uniref:Uncharacterized protein n=1 Tax=Austropuccinia psidii MF-1 TaxID=1389203 RepID=A0A9Q3KKF7_9BASI|nr:hypothetical protein [Austropuccinia psidii MF-1]
MKDSRSFTSSQSLARAFENLLKSSEAETTSLPVVRSEQFPTGNSENIPVSVQELVYGRKIVGVGISAKPLDRERELSSSSKKIIGPREKRRPSEGLDTHFLQRTSPKDKILVEKLKHFFRGPEEGVGQNKENSPVEAPQASTCKDIPQQVPKKGKKAPKRNRKGKGKPKLNKPYC